MMASLLAIRHVAYEDLDGFEIPFQKRGFACTYLDAWYDDFPSDPLEADVLVVLGAPVGVYELTDFPFISEEIDLVRLRLQAGRPVFGVCFGSQIMAAAMGAKVVKGPDFEFGWAPLNLTPSGSTSPLKHYGASGRSVFHCHGDTFDLPKDAELLASTDAYVNQGFSLGPHLAMQFHGEVTERGLRRWYIGHSARIRSSIGQSTLRLQTEDVAAATSVAHDLVVGDWLHQIR